MGKEHNFFKKNKYLRPLWSTSPQGGLSSVAIRANPNWVVDITDHGVWRCSHVTGVVSFHMIRRWLLLIFKLKGTRTHYPWCVYIRWISVIDLMHQPHLWRDPLNLILSITLLMIISISSSSTCMVFFFPYREFESIVTTLVL